MLCSKKLCLNKNILLSMTNNNFSVIFYGTLQLKIIYTLCHSYDIQVKMSYCAELILYLLTLIFCISSHTQHKDLSKSSHLKVYLNIVFYKYFPGRRLFLRLKTKRCFICKHKLISDNKIKMKHLVKSCLCSMFSGPVLSRYNIIWLPNNGYICNSPQKNSERVENGQLQPYLYYTILLTYRNEHSNRKTLCKMMEDPIQKDPIRRILYTSLSLAKGDPLWLKPKFLYTQFPHKLDSHA